MAVGRAMGFTVAYVDTNFSIWLGSLANEWPQIASKLPSFPVNLDGTGEW